MSKRDTITNNLLTLTRSRSFAKAVDGWLVKKLVTLTKQQQSCELCGTRFREGAFVVHRKTGSAVLVGGTCLKTLQAHRFPKKFKFKLAREHTFKTLRAHYRPFRSLVDPGNWLLWLRESAPPRLAQVVSDLCVFGTSADKDQLQKLIRFHDKTRRFPRNALLTDPEELGHTIQTRIPAYITIAQAQQFERQAAKATSPKENAVLDYVSDHVLARIHADDDLAKVWARCGPLARRAVTALAALDDRAVRTGRKQLVSDNIAAKWPSPGEAPMFIWNSNIGLGFVSIEDVFAPPKANVWLWRSARYQRASYSLHYWRGITGCEPDAVLQLEKLAFGLAAEATRQFIEE